MLCQQMVVVAGCRTVLCSCHGVSADGDGRLDVGLDYVAVMYQQMAVVAGCRTGLCSCHVVSAGGGGGLDATPDYVAFVLC